MLQIDLGLHDFDHIYCIITIVFSNLRKVGYAVVVAISCDNNEHFQFHMLHAFTVLHCILEVITLVTVPWMIARQLL